MIEVANEGRIKATENMMKAVVKSRKGVADAGRPVYVPNAEEITAWEKAAEPLWNDWVAKKKAEGAANAQQILDEWKRLVAEGRK